MAVSTLSANAQVETELLGSARCCCEKPENEFPTQCTFVSGFHSSCPSHLSHKVKPDGKSTTVEDCDKLNLKILRKQPGTSLPDTAVKPLERRLKVVTRAESRKRDPMQKCRKCRSNPQNAKMSWLMNQAGSWSSTGTDACECDPEDAGAGRVTTCGEAMYFYACETTHALSKCNQCYQPNAEDLPLNERIGKSGSSTVYGGKQCECENGKVTTCSQAIDFDVCSTTADRITCNMCLSGTRNHDRENKRRYTLAELKKRGNLHMFDGYKHTWECECEGTGEVTTCFEAVDGEACAAPVQENFYNFKVEDPEVYRAGTLPAWQNDMRSKLNELAAKGINLW